MWILLCPWPYRGGRGQNCVQENIFFWEERGEDYRSAKSKLKQNKLDKYKNTNDLECKYCWRRCGVVTWRAGAEGAFSNPDKGEPVDSKHEDGAHQERRRYVLLLFVRICFFCKYETSLC